MVEPVAVVDPAAVGAVAETAEDTDIAQVLQGVLPHIVVFAPSLPELRQ